MHAGRYAYIHTTHFSHVPEAEPFKLDTIVPTAPPSPPARPIDNPSSPACNEIWASSSRGRLAPTSCCLSALACGKAWLTAPITEPAGKALFAAAAVWSCRLATLPAKMHSSRDSLSETSLWCCWHCSMNWITVFRSVSLLCSRSISCVSICVWRMRTSVSASYDDSVVGRRCGCCWCVGCCPR